MVQREEAAGTAEFAIPRQASNHPPPDVPVIHYSSSTSVNGSLFTEILQHAVNWLSTGTGGVGNRIL